VRLSIRESKDQNGPERTQKVRALRENSLSHWADPTRRAKLSHDPNNTEWSRSTTKLGQKILEAQGWQHGDLLGAKDANHAAYHTAASSSHVSIALKDDNLGLGAKHGARQEEGRATGMDTFQDILGRLNGKSTTELEKTQKLRSDARHSAFVDQRWGRLRFVSGGLLVGDEIRKLSRKENPFDRFQETRLDIMEIVALSDSRKAPSAPLKQKKHKKMKSSKAPEASDRTSSDKSSDSTAVKDKRGALANQCESAQAIDLDPQKSGEAQRRAEKAERKLKRKLKRDAKQAMRDVDLKHPATLQTSNPIESQPANEEEEFVPVEAISIQASKNAPQSLGGGRNAVRSRYIQHKKMAIMDSKALNEVSVRAYLHDHSFPVC